ncbi:unnamed protein product [Microthlaspi erraticum]|uniref:Uncharacterized protein n=1 Tax=Microthlaspi erraticum TaxID=1685480 RepID=A0A6D2JGW6_9BRAS|nr:unnamed protein product [Microthlaspi erraticum]
MITRAIDPAKKNLNLAGKVESASVYFDFPFFRVFRQRSRFPLTVVICRYPSVSSVKRSVSFPGMRCSSCKVAFVDGV